MTPINSLSRITSLECPNTQHAPSRRNQLSQELSDDRTGTSAVSFRSQTQNSNVNFGGRNSAPQPQNKLDSGVVNDGISLTRLLSVLQAMLQGLQALVHSGRNATEPSKVAYVGAGSDMPAAGVGVGVGNADPSGSGPAKDGNGSAGSQGGGHFSEHLLGKQLSVQKSSEDGIGMANDPERGDVIKVAFKKGHFTEHSTSPRAEIKDRTKLEEGQPYSFKFGMKREANNDGTFFQVLDHNHAKPSPRAWLATKDGQYQLHLKTSGDSDAPSKVFNLGKPGDAARDVGKWADFQISFKRGIGNGEISVTKNGDKVFDKQGISTMFATHSSNSYAKFGQYRNEGDHKPATSLFSGFSVAKG